MNLFAPILAASPAALLRVPAFTAGTAVPRPTVPQATVGGVMGWRSVRPANTAAVRVDAFDLAGVVEAVDPQIPAGEVVQNVGGYQPLAFSSDDPTRDLLPFAPTCRGGLYTVVRPLDCEGLDEVVSHPVLVVHTRQPTADDAPTDTRSVATIAARSRPTVIPGRTHAALGSQVPAFVVGFHPAAAGVNADGNTELARATRCGPASRTAVSVGGLTPPDPAVFSCGPWAADQFLPGRRAEVITGSRVGSFAREQVYSGSDFTDSVDDTPMPVGGLFVG